EPSGTPTYSGSSAPTAAVHEARLEVLSVLVAPGIRRSDADTYSTLLWHLRGAWSGPEDKACVTRWSPHRSSRDQRGPSATSGAARARTWRVERCRHRRSAC